MASPDDGDLARVSSIGVSPLCPPPHNIGPIAEHLRAKFQTGFISIFFPPERPGRLQRAYHMYLGAPPLPPVAPTTSATSQNTSGPNSQQLSPRSSSRLNSLECFRGPILWTWEPLLCPLWPPQHPPHRRTPRGQIPNNFYFDLLTVWTPWKASGGLSYELGSPSSAPCGPHNIRHIAEHLGAKFQTTFTSIFFSFELPGMLQGPILWTWEPLLCPLWPPQHPPHRRTPRGQIPNNFYLDLLLVWTPWNASGGLSYELGSPSSAPCGPHNICHIAERLGAKFQTTFISIFFSSELSERLQREYPIFWGTPSPICPPLGDRGGGLGGNDRREG